MACVIYLLFFGTTPKFDYWNNILIYANPIHLLFIIIGFLILPNYSTLPSFVSTK